VSTRKASEIPGEIFSKDIPGYLLSRTSGSIEKMIPNIATAAMIVQDSRIFGRRPEKRINITASTGTSTAAKGLIE